LLLLFLFPLLPSTELPTSASTAQYLAVYNNVSSQSTASHGHIKVHALY
jgi:hypothetical protein